MSDHFPAQDARGGEAAHGLRITALIAVIIGVLVLAAAAFVLSYPGIHALARQTGVSPPLARVYPLIIDAMLVVACAAVLSMRGAGLVSRVFSWLSLLVLLAAAAVADALHATATRLPARPAAAAFAVLPWVLVLIAFGLLTAMLRHARMRRLMTAGDGSAARQAGPGGQLTAATEEESPARWEVSQGWPQQAHPTVAALPAALPTAGSDAPADSNTIAGPALAGPALAKTATDETAPDEAAAAGSAPDDAIADLDVDTEPGLDDPSGDEGGAAMTPPGPWVTADPPRDPGSYELGGEDNAGQDNAGEDNSESATALSTPPAADEPAPDPGQPVFHRVRSLPTPPAEE